MSGRRSGPQVASHRNNRSLSGGESKGKRKDNMARKREERAARVAHKKQRQAQKYLSDDETFASFSAQLAKMGLELRDIPGDGNCLFRALGDQLEGHGRDHLKHRRDVVKYMVDHRADFEPFVEDDISFEKHTKNLNNIGTYAGNDAIVAFARLHQLHVVIHQVNSPCWAIHGTENPAVTKELHISYHNGDHYSSIRKLGDQSETPANIKMADTKKAPEQTNGWTNGDYNTFYNENNYDNGEYTEDYLETPQVPENVGDDSETAKALTSEGDMVETIMRMTGCEDVELIQQTLENVGYNMETAIELVFQFMSTSSCQNPAEPESSSSSGIWSESGSGSRIFGTPINGDINSSGAKPKLKQQSASLRQRNKKEEKKARAAERRRQERLGTAAACSGGLSSDEDFHVVADKMGTLKI